MLSFIPTPIGNKEDITLRALRLLKELNVFFCEDTRTTIKLMRMYEIEYRTKELFSLTSFTSDRQILDYVDRMRHEDCGVLSEAWTPWLSDPWKSLIKICREYDVKFEILPWANALISPVIATPSDTSSFVYKWFVPLKKGRKTFFEDVLQTVQVVLQPVYMYESVHRIQKSLTQLHKLWYTGKILIARELTKMYEQYETWSVEEIIAKIESWAIPLKGEFVLWCYPDYPKKWKKN